MSGNEIWKEIPDLVGYEASNLGRIRSLDRVVEFHGRWGLTRRRHKGRVLRLKPKPNGCGVIYWSFYADGRKYKQVNRCVCAAFKGRPPSPLHEAAHLDGDTNNNRPENLEWCTPIENAAHKILHGTELIGASNGASKIDENVVKQIFESYVLGVPREKIAEVHQVSVGTVGGIVSGRNWLHVEVGELRSAAKMRSRTNLEKSWRLAALRRQKFGPTLKGSFR